MSELDVFNKSMNELDDIQHTFKNSKNWNAQDDFDLAVIDGSFDKQPAGGDSFSGCLKFILIAIAVIVLLIIMIVIFGHSGNQQYNFVKYMNK